MTTDETTFVPEHIRELANDVDCELSIIGQAEAQVIEVACVVAKHWDVTDEQYVRLERALALRAEQLPRFERARAEFYRAGGTDLHLRQLAAENEAADAEEHKNPLRPTATVVEGFTSVNK